jgi:hypothetical protein
MCQDEQGYIVYIRGMDKHRPLDISEAISGVWEEEASHVDWSPQTKIKME